MLSPGSDRVHKSRHLMTRHLMPKKKKKEEEEEEEEKEDIAVMESMLLRSGSMCFLLLKDLSVSAILT